MKIIHLIFSFILNCLLNVSSFGNSHFSDTTVNSFDILGEIINDGQLSGYRYNPDDKNDCRYVIRIPNEKKEILIDSIYSLYHENSSILIVFFSSVSDFDGHCGYLYKGKSGIQVKMISKNYPKYVRQWDCKLSYIVGGCSRDQVSFMKEECNLIFAAKLDSKGELEALEEVNCNKKLIDIQEWDSIVKNKLKCDFINCVLLKE